MISSEPSIVVNGDRPERTVFADKVELVVATGLLVAWIGFILFGIFFSAFPPGTEATDRAFLLPGTIVNGKTLYLGTSAIGSDILSDLTSALWFNMWTCGLSAALSLMIAWPVSKSLFSNNHRQQIAANLLVRLAFAMSVFPLLALFVTTGAFLLRPVSLIVLLAIYALPVCVYFRSRIQNVAPCKQRLPKIVFAFFLRRWAALHMLTAVMSFFWWISQPLPGSLVDVIRMNATLFSFGSWVPFLPVMLFVLVAITLRLWASIIEKRALVPALPVADSWMFIPTILEDEVDEWRVQQKAKNQIAS